MLDYVGSIAIRALNIIFRSLPIEFSLWVGRRIGGIVFFLHKKRRMIAYANLKAAFGKEKTPEELRGITKRAYQNLIQTFFEILNLTRVNKAYTDKYVKVVNIERMYDASGSERGTILLTAHFGDWELSSLTSSMHGYPILVLAREQKMKRMNELLNELRESKGCKVIRKGLDVKQIIRALRSREIVGILSDQDAGRGGVLVNFFGRRTSCHVGPMELAKRCDAIVLPNFNVRIKGPYHELHLEEYIDFRLLKSDDPIKEGLQKFASLLEAYIRKYPDQWLWLHKRWKSTPNRTVMVLNDGRAGHLNQSLSVARAIQASRMTQGYKKEDTAIVTLDVEYKNKAMRPILLILSSLASWRQHGRPWALKMCLKPECYDRLMKSYGEFIVSCGSSLAPVNIFMSIENNAKNIVIMKPNIPFGLRQFKCAIIPRHDKPPKRKNVVETFIAPNLVDKESLELSGKVVSDKIKGVKGPFVGIFIGGDNPEFELTPEIASRVIDEALNFASDHSAKLLVTTSRRTSKAVEGLVKKKLEKNTLAPLVVIASENNFSEAATGILALSDMVLVSEESVSMISEAITAGNKVIAFQLKARSNKVTKHEVMINSLAMEEVISEIGMEGIRDRMDRVWDSPVIIKPISDNEKVFEAVRRLI